MSNLPTLTKEEFDIIYNYVDITYSELKGKALNKKKSETQLEVKKLIARYGNDGFGAKPPEMSRVEYWLGHIID